MLRERNVPDEKYYNIFFGYGPEDKNFALELTYNYDKEDYIVGNSLGYYGVAKDSIGKTCDNVILMYLIMCTLSICWFADLVVSNIIIIIMYFWSKAFTNNKIYKRNRELIEMFLSLSNGL